MSFIEMGSTVKIDDNHKLGGMVGKVVEKQPHEFKETRYLVSIRDGSEKRKEVWVEESSLGVW